ncbi:MAG TPA: hypothetical protein VGK56_14300 [Anaerolineales bacterium]
MKYRKFLKHHPVEMITLYILFVIVAAFSVWLPYYFAQSALLGAGITP